MKWLQTLECVFWLNWLMLQNLFRKYHLQLKLKKRNFLFWIYNSLLFFFIWEHFIHIFNGFNCLLSHSLVYYLKRLRFQSITCQIHFYCEINGKPSKSIFIKTYFWKILKQKRDRNAKYVHELRFKLSNRILF